jgi:hypothetical protein
LGKNFEDSCRQLSFFVIIAIVIALWIISSLSLDLAIWKYMLTELQPINSITAKIERADHVDKKYGSLFHVNGFKDIVAGGELGVFYLKKFGPFWYVANVGTSNRNEIEDAGGYAEQTGECNQ